MGDGKALRPEDPAVYCIRVQGFVSARWTEWLEGMQCYLDDTGSAGTVTMLRGRLRDQAALLGLLQRLANLRLPLLEVRFERDDTTADG